MEQKHIAAVKDFDERRQPIVKALVLGDDEVAESNVRRPEELVERNAFQEAGALIPPHDPTTLCMLLEHSNALRQNIDAYQTNIDGFGHRFDPVIDTEADEAAERVANAMYIDMVEAGDKGTDWWPSDEEVQDRLTLLRNEMRREKSRLTSFFENVSLESSFISLRKKTRQDLEVAGNGYWEVLRNRGGNIAQFVYMPGFTVRLLPMRAEDVQEIEVEMRTSDLSSEALPVKKQFRRFVQVLSTGQASQDSGSSTQVVFFKELGDPRIISRSTGKAFATVEELQAADKTDAPATEVLHYKIHSPRSAYGVPRWMGALLSVLGNRQAEEVNFMYFENKSVPPLAVLVSGGRMTEEAVKRITDYINVEIRGKKNFHKILVLEADSDASPNSGQTKIEIKPLTDAQQQDALFQNYDERNIDKVGMSFRLPRLLRGDIRDFNRSTAEAALIFAEMQVFQPEREDFDWIMNRRILAELGIKYWKFASQGPVSKDQNQLADIVRGMVRDSILTPAEGRRIAEDVFNMELPRIDEFWVDQPLSLTQQGYIPEEDFIPADDAAPTGFPTRPDAPVEAGGEAKGDLASSDLKAAGANRPTQGKPKRRKFRRLPPTEKVDDVVAQAAKLIDLKARMNAAEEMEANQAFLDGKVADSVPDDE